MAFEDIKQIKQAFWQTHDRFLKNALITEQPHPDTTELSHLAQTDLSAAIKLLIKIDRAAIARLLDYSEQLEKLHQDIYQALNNGHKLFIAGCGASGRLAASLEYTWRKLHPRQAEQVVSIIAGGDAALIRSIERCEDYPEYGIKQLQQQGFSEHDVLIGTTAGGESPFILGATDFAASHSNYKPWLLYCNPNETLLNRNPNHPISNPKVNGLYLATGPMALTGSTRMQTTTVMLLAIGLALFYSKAQRQIIISTLLDILEHTDFSGLAKFIEAESACYASEQRCLYETEPELGLTILADTTERSPTFNLLPFENTQDQPIKLSGCYLSLLGSHNPSEAWQVLLNRKVRALNWPELAATQIQNLQGFDLSEDYGKKRQADYKLRISQTGQALEFSNSNNTSFYWHIPITGLDYFQCQIILKLALNILSTLVMGRLGFYQGNLMTSLYPSNHKLIDRAIRYVRFLYQQKTGKTLAYETVAEAVFTQMQLLQPGESIVNKTIESLTS